MIKKLQRKFIAIAMLSMLLVTIVIIGTINIYNYMRINSQTDFILRLISENDGTFPEYKNNNTNGVITQESEHSARYFSIKLDENGVVKDFDLKHITIIKEEEIEEIVEEVSTTNAKTGYYENYKYLITETEGNKLIVFLDCTTYIQGRNSIAVISAIIAIVSFLVVFLLVSIFSKRAIKPVIENYERQNQFITNAGHELKTPVAIILANTEVLEIKNNNNEWIESIKNQANRLDLLIKKLLKLSKMEENDLKPNFQKINLSQLLNKVVNSFEVIANKKNLKLEIQPNIEINADADSLYELISILLDNAIKYVTEKGIIKVKLTQKGKDVKLDISNSYENMTQEECKKIFERFYRKDTSRDRKTGGYGIGLSMAESIVRLHKGKIFAKYEDNEIHFIVTI